MKKRYAALALLAAASLAIAGAGAARAAVKLRLGGKMNADHPESVAIARAAEAIKERTGGEVEILCYFGEVLGDSKKQLDNTVSGAQHLYAEGYGFCAAYSKLFRVGTVPYVFRDNEHYRKFLLSDIEKEAEDDLLKKAGLIVVNRKRNWLRGPFRVIASRRPVRSLDDLKGLKLRMSSAPASVKSWEQLGCAVSVIPYSETYLALRQGAVDALTCPVVDAYLYKFCEVAPYITVTNEYPQQVAVLMNARAFSRLTERQREILLEEFDKAGEYVTERALSASDEIIRKMKDEYGVTVIEPDLAPWRERMEPFIASLEKSGYIPAGCVERIRAIR